MLLAVISSFIGLKDSYAKERDFTVGASFSFNYFLEPDSRSGDNSLNFQFDFDLTDYLFWTSNFELGINGFSDKYIVTGAKWIPYARHSFSPYVAMQAIMKFDDRLDGGFRGSGGLQLDLTQLVGWYDIIVFYEANLSILFREPASAFADIFRFGIMVGF